MRRARLEWFAAAFGLLVGLTMVYVPYEFGASAFRHVHTHVRGMGALFLTSSVALVVALLYPAWPALARHAARGLFLATLALYWWRVALLGGGMTGALLYPLMAAGVVLEGLPRWQGRGRGLLRPFLAAVAVAFGALMVLWPSAFGASMYTAMQPVLRPVGGAYVAGGLLLAAAELWPGGALARAGRAALVLLGALFAHMAATLGGARAWTGMELYALLALGCALELAGVHRLPAPAGVRWRLVRGSVLASVLPLLVLGAVGSVVAQRAIERELHTEALLAAGAEAAWLDQVLRTATAVLHTEAVNPVLHQEVARADLVALERRLARLERNSVVLDALWVLDARGEVMATSPALAGVGGNFAGRDYFREARATGRLALSEPFLGEVGRPFVVFALPLGAGGPGERAVLSGGLELTRFGGAPSLASGRYHVQVVDQRRGLVLRDTRGGAPLSPERLAAPIGAAATGTAEAFAPDGQLLLQAHARVAGAPWVVVVTSRLQDAYAPVTRLGASAVLVALGAGLLALLLSRWVGRDVAGRVEALRDGFADFEAGQPPARPLTAHGDDELAELTRGFLQMTERIARSQAQLREAVAVREQFLSVASHELRTPLTPLRTSLELLLRQVDARGAPDPARLRGTLERSLRQVDRLTRLVGDMLDVTRLQGGRFSLQRVPTDLAALAHEALERVRQSPAGGQAALTLEAPEGGLVGHWDGQRLEQVLTNLVENALRYSPPPARVAVRLRREGAEALLEVQDAGIGIPPESLEGLFTPFFRAPNAAEHHAGGLGLGLSICREIVDRHGGRIEVHSAGTGQGTLFRVRLPVADGGVAGVPGP